jgi:hypothetical protein
VCARKKHADWNCGRILCDLAQKCDLLLVFFSLTGDCSRLYIYTDTNTNTCSEDGHTNTQCEDGDTNTHSEDGRTNTQCEDGDRLAPIK